MNLDHPLWQTIHWVLVIAVIGVVLRLNASSFDETEIRSLVQIALALAGMLGAKAWVKSGYRRRSKPKEENDSGEAGKESTTSSWFDWR
jgi:hypothetical protein